MTALALQWMWPAAGHRQDEFRLELLKYFRLQLRVRKNLRPHEPIAFSGPLYRLLRAAVGEGVDYSSWVVKEPVFLDVTAEVVYILSQSDRQVQPSSHSSPAGEGDDVLTVGGCKMRACALVYVCVGVWGCVV